MKKRLQMAASRLPSGRTVAEFARIREAARGGNPNSGEFGYVPYVVHRSAWESSRHLSLAILLLCVLVVPRSLAQEKKPEKDAKATPAVEGKKSKVKKVEGFSVLGTLTPADPTDKVRGGCFFKVHPYKMAPGKTYMIDLIDRNASSMDPYLRLETSTGANLMQDDDGGGNLNSRLMFTPTVEDTYRIIVTTCSSGRAGDYLLKVTPLAIGTPPPPPMMRPGSMSSTAPIKHSLAISASMEMGDIVITPLIPMGNPGLHNTLTHGYLEYRFVVENRSATQGHQVHLALPRWPHAHRWGNYLRSISKTVDIGPGATVQVSLFQPDMPLAANNDVKVTIDGREKEQGVPLQYQVNRGARYNQHPYHSHSGGGDFQVILASEDLFQQLSQNVSKATLGREDPSGAFLRPQQFHTYEGTVAGWSKHWLGYSSFDGIAVSAAQLQAAPPEIQHALWQFAECGGALLIAGAHKVPESWLRSPSATKGLEVYYPGFGQCVVAAKDVSAWDSDAWQVISDSWENSYKAWSQIRTATDAHREFPVVEDLAIPVRGLFLVMFAFVILIGPVNIYWLSKHKRRIWLLWTVPVFSLFTCALLFGYMVVSEGWHGHVRAVGVTVLDEVSQRAATLGWLGYYSPTSPGGGLSFDQQSELTPLLVSDHRLFDRSQRPRTIDWTNEQHFDSGWITAKVPAHFLLRRNEKRLERVLVRRNGADLVLVNGLKADVRVIWVAGADGKLYSAQNIQAGAETSLTPAGDLAGNEKVEIGEGFAGNWLDLARNMEKSPRDYLRPGCYLAVLDDGPFLEQGLRHVQTRKMKSIVLGIMKEPL